MQLHDGAVRTDRPDSVNERLYLAHKLLAEQISDALMRQYFGRNDAAADRTVTTNLS